MLQSINTQYYLYSSPSKEIRLIPGEIMPVISERPIGCLDYVNLDRANYQRDLKRAKEESILVADQLRATKMIMLIQGISTEYTSIEELTRRYLKEDTIYGPFTGGYRITHQHSGFGEYLNSDLPFTESPPSGYCSGTYQVAILSDTQQEIPKAYDYLAFMKEQYADANKEDAVFSVMEIARMESIPAAERYKRIKEQFTIIRK